MSRPQDPHRTASTGSLIYPQDMAAPGGRACHIVSGSVRLDRHDGEQVQPAGIALPGDLIGAETLLFERTTFAARAVSPVELAAWLRWRPTARSDAPS